MTTASANINIMIKAARKAARELPQHLLDPSEERMLAEQFGLMIPLNRRKD